MADSVTSVVGSSVNEGDAPVLKVLPARLAPWAMILGALGAIASTFMSWTGSTDFPGNLTIAGNPADIQKLTIVGAVLVVLFALVALGMPGLRWLAPHGA